MHFDQVAISSGGYKTNDSLNKISIQDIAHKYSLIRRKSRKFSMDNNWQKNCPAVPSCSEICRNKDEEYPGMISKESSVYNYGFRKGEDRKELMYAVLLCM